MKERPILFSGPMVRAILDGRKTQTRRVVKFPSDGGEQKYLGMNGCGLHVFAPGGPGWGGEMYCPYGQVGDRLWVRETWMETCDRDTLEPNGKVIYRATWVGPGPVKCDGDGFTVWNKDGTAASPWRPSIHMPRWASRLTLEITGVRVERLQDISEADTIAEGVQIDVIAGDDGFRCSNAKGCFQELWESINGQGSWDANPWVWVVGFKVVTP